MSAVLQGGHSTQTLPAYSLLTIVAAAGAAGSIVRLADSMGGEPQGVTPIAAGETVTIGPFAVATRHDIICTAGELTYSAALVDYPTLAEALAGAAAAVPGLAVPATGRPATVIEMFGAGAPVAPVQASLSVNPAGDDNALTFTAVEYGAGGNAISIEYREQAALGALAVTVTGKAIVVLLEMDAGALVVSTAAEVKAAIEASTPAAALVTVAIDTTDTGVADDGSGVVTAMAATTLANGAGTGVGTAGKGSRYTDHQNGALYLNVGTAAQPNWSQLAFVP